MRSFQNYLIVMGNVTKEGHPLTKTQGDGKLFENTPGKAFKSLECLYVA